MKERIIKYFVGIMIAKLEAEDLKKWMDMGLDLIEDAVEKSETEWDNIVVLPLCKTIRISLDIPDNDEEVKEME